MRITDIFIRGYGIFSNCHVPEIPPGVIVFQGVNEAGKSTCLSFIRDMFFGFPDKRMKEKSYPPLMGGRQGGILTLETGTRDQISLERGPGQRGGHLSITDSTGRVLAPDQWQGLLGGTTREVFKNIYAFSLNELQSLNSLSSEKVKSALYSAGLGAGLKSFTEVAEELQREQARLFKPGGQKPEINKALKELEEVRGAIRESTEDIQHYDHLVLEIKRLEQELKDLKARINESRQRTYRLQSMHALWEEWTGLETARQDLAVLPEIGPFPEEGLQRYQKLGQDLENRQESLGRLRDEIAVLKEKIAALEIDTGIISLEQEIVQLVEGKNEYTRARQEVVRLESLLQARQGELNDLFGSLGPDWSEDRLLETDLSLFTTESVITFRDTLFQLQNTKDRAAERVKDQKEDRNRAENRLKLIEQELKGLAQVAMTWDEQIFQEVKGGRERFAGVVEETPELRTELAKSRAELTRMLREIDPSWTEEDLFQFDGSLQAQELVQGYERDFLRVREQRVSLLQKQELVQGEQKKLQSRLQDKQQALEELKQRKFDSLEHCFRAGKKLKQLREARATQENLRVRLEGIGQQIVFFSSTMEGAKEFKTLKHIAHGGLVCLVLALILWGLCWGMGRPGLGLGLGGGLLGLALLLAGSGFLLKRQQQVEKTRKEERDQARKVRLQELQAERGRVQEELRASEQTNATLQGELGLSSAEPESLDSLDEDLEKARETLHRVSGLQQEIDGLLKETAAYGQELESIQEQLGQVNQERDNLETSWSTWLDTANLLSHLTPRGVLQIFSRIEKGRAEQVAIQKVEQRLEKMETNLRQYLDKAEQLPDLKDLDRVDQNRALSRVDQAIARMDKVRDQLREKELIEHKLAEQRKICQQAGLELQGSEKTLAACREEHSQALSAWKQWLEERDLDQELTPETALQALKSMEQGRGLMREIKGLSSQKATFQGQVEQIESVLETVCKSLDREFPDRESVVSSIEMLAKELNRSREYQNRQKELQLQLPEKQSQMQKEMTTIKDLEEKIRDLFGSAGVEDEQTFLDRGRLATRAMELQESIRTKEKHLQLGLGVTDFSVVADSFQGWTREGLAAETEQSKQELDRHLEQEQGVTDQIGRLKSELERLVSAEELAGMRFREEGLLEEIRQLALRWTRYTLARHLMRRAKEKYEEQQQPQVILRAGHYFATITDHRYTQIFAPLGGDDIQAVTASGERKSPDELSRGTAEQLYLALRFGYVEQAGQTQERLPMVMDDILVNFDPARAEKAAETILELGRTNQVLYFTCHPETAACFRKTDPGVPVFSLENQEFSRKKSGRPN